MNVRPRLIGSSAWRDRPVFLIGGGPSAAQHIEAVHGRGLCIAVNDSFRKCPWADGVFTIDDYWLSRRYDELKAFAGAIVVGVPLDFAKPLPSDVERIECRKGASLSDDPSLCFEGDNSGFAALCWAIANGAHTIVLLGYDMDQAGHWHGGYEWKCKFGVRDYPKWRRHFEMIAHLVRARGVDVVNLNFNSRIRCFRFERLDRVLREASPQPYRAFSL